MDTSSASILAGLSRWGRLVTVPMMWRLVVAISLNTVLCSMRFHLFTFYLTLRVESVL